MTPSSMGRDGSVIWPGGRRPRAQGHALLTVMMAIACLLPLGAFAAMQARLDFLVQHATRTALETFAVAESGLEHALADVAADSRFDRLLAGPDRRLGTADDGEFPFAHPPPATFPAAPFAYQVQVAAAGPDLLDIVSRGSGPRGAVRVVSASVARDALPAIPAALAVSALGATIGIGAGMRISGLSGTADPDLPAVAMASSALARATAAALPSAAQRALTGRGGPPSVDGGALPAVTPLNDAVRALGGIAFGEQASGALGNGLFRAPGALRLVDASGSGMLVVGGTLELAGTVQFSGVIVALGDLRIAPGSTVDLGGAIFTGGAVVSLLGDGMIAYDPRAIARVDAAYPGVLPRRARITGWRERPEAVG
jgi:hypothetical protein